MKLCKLNWNYYRPNVLESWLIILAGVMFVGNIFGLVVDLIMKNVFPASVESGLAAVVVYIFTFLAPFLYVAYRICDNIKHNKQEYPAFKPGFGRIGVVGILLISIVALPMIGILTEPLFGWWKMPQTMVQAMRDMAKFSCWAFLSVAVLAPIAEEFLLRGVILRGLLHHNTPAKAILWSAAMFAIMHGNLWQAVPAFCFGCFFGWIFYRTRCVWLSVFCHAFTNGVTYLLLNLYPDMDPQSGWKWFITNGLGCGNYYFLFIIAALALLAICVYFLNKFMAASEQKPKVEIENE